MSQTRTSCLCCTFPFVDGSQNSLQDVPKMCGPSGVSVIWFLLLGFFWRLRALLLILQLNYPNIRYPQQSTKRWETVLFNGLVSLKICFLTWFVSRLSSSQTATTDLVSKKEKSIDEKLDYFQIKSVESPCRVYFSCNLLNNVCKKTSCSLKF